MPNDYSIEIHRYLQEQIEKTRQTIEAEDGASPFSAGKLEELLRIREFLSKHIDLKDFKYY